METSLVALTCPKCGSSDQVISKDLIYGYQFTCQFCHTTSVLIINDQLYIPKPGENICPNCGRVADRDVRFCQCGSSLVRECNNPHCHREIPINHKICDFCGWNQGIVPGTEEGDRIILSFQILEELAKDPKANDVDSLAFRFLRNYRGIENVKYVEKLFKENHLAISEHFSCLLVDLEAANYVLSLLLNEGIELPVARRNIINSFGYKSNFYLKFDFIEANGGNPLEYISEMIKTDLPYSQFASYDKMDEYEFFEYFIWVFESKHFEKYHSQLLNFCEFYFSFNLDTSYAPPLRASVPFLVELAFSTKNKNVKINCLNILGCFLGQTFSPMPDQVEYLENLLQDPSISRNNKLWVGDILYRAKHKIYRYNTSD